MKINGQPLPKPSDEIVVLPRGKQMEPDPQNPEQQIEVPVNLVFKCRAVLDYKEFEAMVPEPKPPMSIKRGETQATPDFGHPKFTLALNDYGIKKQNWLMIQSIMATEGVSWEKVRLNDPETWNLWQDELQESGLGLAEILRIQQAVLGVNGLDDSKIDEARRNFLAQNPQSGR
jgi:hypothetical protein